MTEEIKQIAERLRGLRESLDLTSEELAKQCEIDAGDYVKYESGEADIPMSALHNIAAHMGVELTGLLSGDEPHVSSFAVTRKGQGLVVERRKAYRYQSLAAAFKQRRAEPFIVTVEHKADSEKPIFNTHDGQEFNLVLEGEMTLFYGDKEIILHQGDSIYFNPQTPHAMRANNGTSCTFLATIVR